MAHSSRNFVFAAFAALVLPLLCDCTPETPETQLTWDANDTLHLASAPRTYASRDGDAAEVKPAPRPAQTSYTPAAHCSCDDAVTVAPLPAASGPVSFVWPVSGPVISSFGSDLSGARNDGINIAATLGEPIHAAASGDVIYAGNELKGYGNLVLIKHSDGYVTAYAHAERMLVAKGDFVAKGQVIGYAGATGDVTTPQLHFEIRHDTQPVNPRPLLVASR